MSNTIGEFTRAMEMFHRGDWEGWSAFLDAKNAEQRALNARQAPATLRAAHAVTTAHPLRRGDDVVSSPPGLIERVCANRGVPPPPATHVVRGAAAQTTSTPTDCAPSPTHGLIERVRAAKERTR